MSADYSDDKVAAALLNGGRPYADKLTYGLGLPPDTKVVPLWQVAELTAFAVHPDKTAPAWERCKNKHTQWFRSDIKLGGVRVLDPDTGLPYWPSDLLSLSNDDLDSALVLVDDFASFAKSIGIDVWFQSSAARSPTGTQQGHKDSPNTDCQPSAQPKSKAPATFVDSLNKLIAEIDLRAQKSGRQFDKSAMPGRKVDFQELANNWDSDLKYAERTFSDYLKGVCQFTRGARESDFYRQLFPECFK